MDIAALSMVLNQGKLQQEAGLSVMKMAMGTAAEQGESIAALARDMTKTMALSVQPYLGANIDVMA